MINDVRVIASFPTVTNISLVDDEIQNHRIYYGKVITNKLNKIAPREMINTIQSLVNNTTNSGSGPCPSLTVDIIENYAVKALRALEKGEYNIKNICEHISTILKESNDQNKLLQFIMSLEKAAKSWHFLARPIQLCSKSRGLNDSLIKKVYLEIRKISLSLCNQYKKNRIIITSYKFNAICVCRCTIYSRTVTNRQK